MPKQRMIIISGENKEFCEPCAEALRRVGYEAAFCPKDGAAILSKIEEIKPEVVLMDIFMCNIDAMGVLDKMAEWDSSEKPECFTYASSEHPYLVSELMRRGATYHFVLPFDFGLMADRIANFNGHRSLTARQRESGKGCSDNLESAVTAIILDVGVPAHIKGYQYLRDSIILAVEDKNVINGITKILYPTVAKMNGTTSSRVERAIRHAIEVAWDRGDVDVLNSYFGYTVHNLRGKPTNSEFVAMIADKIRLERKLASVG